MKGSCYTLLPIGLALFAMSGQSKGPTVVLPQDPPVEKRVTDRKGNRKGSVLVIMYHKTGPEEKFMVRSYKNFQNDLLRLHKMGYRPVTMHEYVTNTMALPRGAMPVVMTFDDSHATQFTYLKDGKIDPNCFVGLWEKFAEKNPDFPVKGTFYVLPNGPFGQKSLRDKKVAQLKAWGCEIGSHTMSHTALNKLEDDDVKKELAESYEYVGKLGFVPYSFAMPYGIAPKNRGLMKSFEYKGKSYGYQSICLAGSSPAPSPLSSSFDRTRIPRVQAFEGEYGLTWWLNRVSNGKSKPYVQP